MSAHHQSIRVWRNEYSIVHNSTQKTTQPEYYIHMEESAFVTEGKAPEHMINNDLRVKSTKG
jgi:hypothetical protein